MCSTVTGLLYSYVPIHRQQTECKKTMYPDIDLKKSEQPIA